MTRLIPRKSLLVFGLIISVLGFSAAAAFASVHSPAAAQHQVARSAAEAAAVTGHDVVTTAYIHPAGTVPSAPGPNLTTPDAAPASICTVPGIGSIGNLLGFCTTGAGGGGVLGSLNSICSPSLPQPEPANSGIDSIVRPPANSGPQGQTLYDNYGVAGQFWAATGLSCSDMTSLIGNNVAGMVFDAAKAVDRVTITVYQSAAGNGILNWLGNVVNRLISSLGNAIYFPYLVPVVLLGVMWLAWHGLIRKRASRTIEGTIWMVVACVAAIWLIGRPADFTGFGQNVSNGVTQILNVGFSKLPNPGQTSCVPVSKGDLQSPGTGNYGFTSGNGMVDQNANELWTVLVCKPWLDGEFGTTTYATGKTGQTPVNTYGRQLLWSQAIAANEKPTSALIQAKQSAYAGIASSIKQNDPAIYPLFQGNQWTSRMEIGFAALFAALVAGVLILLIAVTLIILKLGFLLLLIVGPFFLLIGTHPGFGRVVAIRWVEMIVGVLIKGAVVALALSLLLYAYSLIMGTSDSVLPWALKILMLALVTVAVFIYRKPFQHLFAATDSYTFTDRRDRRSDRSSREMVRTGTLSAAAAASGFAGARLGRWSRRDGNDAAAVADSIAAAGGGPGTDPDLAAGKQAALTGAAGENDLADPDADADADGHGVRATSGSGRALAAAEADGMSRSAPPLHLPAREAANGDAASGRPSGWARGGAEGTGAGRSQSQGADAPRTVTQSGAMIGAGSARPASPGRPALPTGSPGHAPARQPAQGQANGSAPARYSGQAPARQVPPAPAGPAPAGQPPARQSGPAPARQQGPAPARYSGGSSTPRPAPRSAGPASRSAAPAPSAPSSSGSGPRARWRDEAPSRQAPESRGGRPLWQPGPMRSSSGGSAGSRGGSAPQPPAPRPQRQSAPPPAPAPRPQRQSAPPPAPAPRAQRQSAPPPARQSPPPSGPAPRPQRQGPPPRQSGPAASPSSSDAPRSHFFSRPGNGGQASAGPNPAGQAGQGAASGQGGAPNGRDQDTPHGPFWLRPVRRKK